MHTPRYNNTLQHTATHRLLQVGRLVHIHTYTCIYAASTCYTLLSVCTRHCNTLHCNTLQHIRLLQARQSVSHTHLHAKRYYVYTLNIVYTAMLQQHTATHTATHQITTGNALSISNIYAYIYIRCIYTLHTTMCAHSTLQHTATHCNTLQHTATHCTTPQHTATHCNTLITSEYYRQDS